MIPRVAFFVSLLTANLLLAGASFDPEVNADEIKIRFDPGKLPYVTARHLRYIRAKLRRMVSDDELPNMRVVIEVPGEVRATLPEFRDSTYAIQRVISMHASDWPSWIGWEKGEPGAGVSWSTSRVVVANRIFDLDGETVEMPVYDEMSFDETKRVLMAIRHGMISVRQGCNDRGRPKLKQVFQVRRNRSGEFEVVAQTNPYHRWGPVFVGSLKNGIFEIRGYGHWDS